MDAIRVANFTLIGVLLLATGLILAFGQRWARLRDFRTRMLAQWKPALVISLLFLLGMGLGGRGIVNPYAIAIFCEAMLGLALAGGIAGYKALPLTEAVVASPGRWQAALWGLVFAFLGAVAATLVGSVGMSVAQSILHETSQTSQMMKDLTPGPWQAFWLFLAGAGIAEETLFRLLVVSLLLRWLGRSGWAVVLAALLFGAYHLSPLNSLYQSFLQFPISQFLASVLTGLIWGWLFIRRGYETTVLAHTLSDWLPMLLFS